LGAYYAHKGNRFWKTLAEVGFTDRVFAPEEFRQLALLNLGLTDLCKTQSGMDSKIDKWDIEGFNRKITQTKPHAVAFTGKHAASVWSFRKSQSLAFGWLKHNVPEFPPVYVLPSTSGAKACRLPQNWSRLHIGC
jgi:TDG/mug DNA glycosylase family protein